jgi:hypothetical protein
MAIIKVDRWGSIHAPWYTIFGRCVDGCAGLSIKDNTSIGRPETSSCGDVRDNIRPVGLITVSGREGVWIRVAMRNSEGSRKATSARERWCPSDALAPTSARGRAECPVPPEPCEIPSPTIVSFVDNPISSRTLSHFTFGTCCT